MIPPASSYTHVESICARLFVCLPGPTSGMQKEIFALFYHVIFDSFLSYNTSSPNLNFISVHFPTLSIFFCIKIMQLAYLRYCKSQ